MLAMASMQQKSACLQKKCLPKDEGKQYHSNMGLKQEDRTKGATQGGLARAASLSPTDRQQIARRAAEARWGNAARAVVHPLLPKETHAGILKIGVREIPCSVLDNNLRVFSIRGLNRAMGYKHKGAGSPSAAAPQLPAFLAASNINELISNDLSLRLIAPIQYVSKINGQIALGYEATLLPAICEAILDANKAGVLRASQRPLADTAEIFIRGFARVGVIALVDEATGYQEERAKDELAKILEAYVQEQFRPWTRMFPEEFFRQIYRIHGWPYKPGNARRTPFCGHLINKYVYGQLPPGVLDELRRLNPIQEGGYRKRKHFQYLTADTGNEHLDRQITSVVTLMRISDSKEELEHHFAKAFGKPSPGFQQRLPLIVEIKK
jgi:hypothetical protein